KTTIGKVSETVLISSKGNEIFVSDLERKNIAELNSEFIDFEEETDESRNEWFTAYSVPVGDISEDYLIVPWNIHNSIIIDGNYELRAKTVSLGSAGHGYSDIISGTIDRDAPLVFGLPEPIDGILEPNDLIAIHFNENINSEIISIGNQDITLTNTVTGQLVDFTFTAGFNTITIEPAVNNEWIENQTLRVDINYLEDMNGNAINASQDEDDRISWEFFVNRNPLGWTTGGINDVVIYVDETYSTTKILKNNGGSNRSFEMIGGRSNGAPDGDPLPLPEWLEITPLSGVLTPGNESTISISLVDGIAAGWYQTIIYANGVMGDEPLPIDIRVLEYPPEWEVDSSDYQFSMTMTAVVETDGVLTNDLYDKIGVFVGDELRGVADLIYLTFLDDLGLHAYEVFLTIYSNQLSGEDLSFRVWDASESIELGYVEEDYQFNANSALGSPTSPVTITATSQIISRIPVTDGWSWLSLNLEPTDLALNSVLSTLESSNNDIIKDQTSFAQFVNGYGWAGSLLEIDTKSMYLMSVAETDTLEIVGYPINIETDTISVVEGWNWISYLPQTAMVTSNALYSLEGAATGDVIKSQDHYAQFVENYGWYGSLQFMVPFEGYLLKLTNAGELVYPFETPSREVVENSVKVVQDELSRDLPDWSVNPAEFENNMNITGTIIFED
ncbi:MAG: hypothetical protein U9N34_08000, partial [Candidatus Cloacimonadota bacterium]|nr:hypothetical protein [Candidatus Cloacimonadota bacterium]